MLCSRGVANGRTFPARRVTRLRLRLDELEPRVAPSSLLYDLPFLAFLSDRITSHEPARAAYLDFPEENSVPASAEHAADAEEFSPVVPAELEATDSTPRQRDQGEIERQVVSLETDFGSLSLVFDLLDASDSDLGDVSAVTSVLAEPAEVGPG